MKVAKNMDSVFDQCTQDELDFEAFFDHDDCLIDMVAGVDEAGNLLTGEEVDIVALIAADEAAEGTEDKPLEVGGEVGDGKEVSGKENSAESHADDTTDEEKAIGAKDVQQTSLEGADPLTDDDEAERAGETDKDTIETECVGLCPKCGSNPCKCNEKDPFTAYTKHHMGLVKENEDISDKLANSIMESILGKVLEDVDVVEDKDDEKMRDGSESRPTNNVEGRDADPVGAAIRGIDHSDILKDGDDDKLRAGSEKEDDHNIEGVRTAAVETVDIELEEEYDITLEETDPIEDNCDAGCRAGKCDRPTNNVEGRDADPIGAAANGIDHSDILKDGDDDKLRAGSEKEDDHNIEGVKSKIVEAVLAKLADKLEDTVDIDNTQEVVPDTVEKDAAANEIKPDRETVYETVADKIMLMIEGKDDDLVDDEDDDLIELADSEEGLDDDEELDLDYDCSDEELVDIVLSGDDKDLDISDVE